MFELTEETRNNVIAVLRSRLDLQGHTDEELNEIIDEVVGTVKAQFGF